MSRHWTEKLFIENSELFRSTIDARFNKTEREVKGLLKILEEYGAKPGGLILDLGCGVGRVSIPLAKMGYNVVGVDLSPSYIQAAKKYAEKENVSEKTSFFVGDMREISNVLNEYSSCFNAVINMWTSMGYWDEETDIQIMKKCKELVKPEGIFIMHTANRDYLIDNLAPRDYADEADMIVLMDHNLDLETSRVVNYWSYYKKNEKSLQFLGKIEINHRVYSLHEIIRQFQTSGWKILAYYGGLDQRKFTIKTHGMVVIATI